MKSDGELAARLAGARFLGSALVLVEQHAPLWDGFLQNVVLPTLNGAGVVTTRGHIRFVVTEHGVVNLYGKGLQERAQLLIGIAAPEHREVLERAYRERFHGDP